jgi:hypothetical protein
MIFINGLNYFWHFEKFNFLKKMIDLKRVITNEKYLMFRHNYFYQLNLILIILIMFR